MHRSRASTGPAGCALAVALLLLAGCGGNGDPAAESSQAPESAATGSASSGPAASVTPELDPGLASAASALAGSAQAEASQLPSGAVIEPRSGNVVGADISWPQCPPGMGIPHKISQGLPLPT